jgi:organic radical activating enzyme
VGCHWCDVKESWNAELHPPSSINQIVSNAKYSETVVVTGEPLMWDDAMTQTLENGRKVHIETSGAYPLTGTWD